MTEKRYKFDEFYDVIIDTSTNKEYSYHNDEKVKLIVEELNRLHNENMMLKGEIEY